MSERGFCRDCPFWEVGGECRFSPPVQVVTDEVFVWKYPITKNSDWCGQHPARRGQKGRMKDLNG